MIKLITQHRRGTSDEWLQMSHIVVADGELVIEECPNGERKLKVGDGKRSFAQLPYVTTGIETLIRSLGSRVSMLEGSNTDTNHDWETEVQGIRYPLYGEAYECAGDAVRANEQAIKDVSGSLDELRFDLEAFIGADAVNGLLYDENTGELYLAANGTPVGDAVIIRGGGGGGGDSPVAATVRLKNQMGSTKLTIIPSDRVEILASFYEKVDGEYTSSPGTLQILYRYDNNAPWTEFKLSDVQKTVTQEPDIFAVNIASIIDTSKTVMVNVKVVGGETGLASNEITYNVTAVEGTIQAIDFDSTQVFDGNTTFKYKVTGYKLQKTLVFEMDGDATFYTEDIGMAHNEILTAVIDFSSLESGSHNLTVYFRTDQGAVSNKLNYSLLYNKGDSNDVMFGATTDNSIIDFGDNIVVRYSAYTPGKDFTDDIVVTMFGEIDGDEVIFSQEELSQLKPEIQYEYIKKSYESFLDSTYDSTVYVKFEYGDSKNRKEQIIEFTVRAADTDGYNVKPVTSGLVYAYNASTVSSTAKDRNVYTYTYVDKQKTQTNIKAYNTGFNWRSNGYVSDTSDALVISGDARHTIDLPVFAGTYVDDDGQTIYIDDKNAAPVVSAGRTIEIDLSINNVTDVTANVVKCMTADHSGFVITPTYACILSKEGANIETDGSTGFITNERNIAYTYIQDSTRMRISFVIEPLGTQKYLDTSNNLIESQCINIYINGQYANSFIYPNSFTFSNNEQIVIGDNSCIVKLHEVRIYNTYLTQEQVLQNYNVSPLNLEDKVARLVDEDVLNDDNEVDYDKAKYKYNCLLLTGQLAPDKENERYTGITLTRVDSEGNFSEEFSLMDKDETGAYVSYNKVQGTSSVKFPKKNYKVYLRKLSGSEVKKVKYSLKGKDEDGRDLSIGESTLCFKADYMSSDHPNTFNANLADTLFSDKTIAQQENPLVQNTVWGFRCLLFQQDTAGGPIKFVSDGALNNDKGNTKTFGLEVEGDEVIVRAKIGKHSDVVCLSDAQIVTKTDDASTTSIDFLDAISLVEDYENDTFTDGYYYIEGLLSYNLDIEDTNKCLMYEDDDEELHSIYLLGLKDSKGVDYDKSTSCPHIADYANLTTRQKWEFLNNTEDLCSFKTDKFFATDSAGTLMVTKALESTYPDQKDLKEDYGVTPDYTALQLLFTWVCQRANFWEESDPDARAAKKAIFKNEFNKHFNLEHALVYYLFMEFVGLCDNRAKNMFLRCENMRNNTQLKLVSGESVPYDDILDTIVNDDGSVNADIIDWTNSKFDTWLIDLYDLDSGFGVENSGYMDIPYYADWDYHLGVDEDGNPAHKFNGYDSVFWMMFEEAFASEIQSKAQNLTGKETGKGALNYESMYKYHIEDNALLVCSNIVNRDMIAKYSDPWINGYLDASDNQFKHTSEYKYLQRGSRTAQKSAYIYKRTNMLYSKYKCSQFVNNHINFRAGIDVPEENTDISLRYSHVIFPGVKYGDGDAVTVYGPKTYPDPNGEPCTITKTGGVGSSDTIYLLGGKNITTIEGISKFQPYEIQLQNGQSLRELNIGSNEDGYENNALTSVKDLNSCPLLETLNVAGCKQLTTIDVSKNPLLKNLDVRNTSISNIDFADGGVIENVYANDLKLSSISLVDLNKLQSFNTSDFSKLTKLRLENVPSSAIDGLTLIQQEVPNSTPGSEGNVKLMQNLDALRLSGVNTVVNNSELLDILTDSTYMSGKYMDDKGVIENSSRYPYIAGTIYYDGILEGNKRAELDNLYESLTINFKEMTSKVSFFDTDNTKISEKIITAYDSNLSNVEEIDLPAIIPEKEFTDEWGYYFIGWSTQPNIIIECENADDYLTSEDYDSYIKDACKDIVGDRNLYPAFSKIRRSYVVTFYNGIDVVGTLEVKYGHNANTSDVQHIQYGLQKPNTENPEIYEFQAWVPNADNIIADRNCYAQFTVKSDSMHQLTLDELVYVTDPSTYNVAVSPNVDKFDDTDTYKILSIAENYDIERTKYSTTAVSGFQGTNVVYVELPRTLERIEGGSFEDCQYLDKAVVPTNVTYIGSRSFAGTPSLERVEYNAVNAEVSGSLGYYPFDITSQIIKSNISPIRMKYDGLDIYIGRYVERVPDNLFYQYYSKYTNVSNIFFEEGTKDLAIGAFAFYQCDTHNVVFSSNVSSIGAHAFTGASFTDLNLTDNITSIGNFAFQHNPNIKKVHIPDKLETLNQGCLWGSPNIETFTLNTDAQGNNINPYYRVSNGLVTYHRNGINTIAYATKDANLSAAEGVDSIHDYAFAEHKFTSIDIPECIQSLGIGAFYGCKDLVSLRTRGLTYLNNMVFYECNNLSEVTLNEGLENIGTFNFGCCRSLKNIVLPSSIRSVEQNAFYECTSLENVTFNSGIEEVSYCFNNTKLLKYKIYNNGKYVGNSDNPYLVFIGVVDGVGVDIDTGENIAINDNDTVTIHPDTKVIAQFAVGTSTGIDKTVKVINIPESVQYVNVAAFKYSYALTNINVASAEGSIIGQAPWGANSAPEGDQERPEVTVTYNYKEE